VVTYFLREVDFAPLRALVSFEDSLYTTLIPPSLELKSGFHPIIFVDIDDEAIRRWGAPQGAGSGTPRTLLAEITHILRHARASVIFLDYDFRNQLQGDSALREELATYSTTPVLLPKYFSSGLLPLCEAQTEEKAPIELDSMFDDLANNGNSVAPVHSIVALGAYGLIDGICSAYKVRVGDREELVFRQAAMLRAVELADLSSGIYAVPKLIPIRWWIKDDTALLCDRTGAGPAGGHRHLGECRPHFGDKVAYARIKASLYVHKNGVDTEGIDINLENAIVIVSSTHRWSSDVHATPVGELPGALVHANLGLGLESFPVKEIPLPIQFLVDFIPITVAVFITFPLCWYPLYKHILRDARLTLQTTIYRLIREGLVIVIVGILFMGLFLLLTLRFGDFLAGWRFGMLSFILSALVVLLIEVNAAITDAAARLAEAVVMRFCKPRSRLPESKPRLPNVQAPE
jgi:hypothetical protein